MVIAVVDDEINRQNSSSFRRSSVLQIRHCMLWICCCLCLCSGYLSICDAFTFHDMTYEDLTHASYELHGDYTTIKTAEELYGIPKAKQSGYECSPAIIRVSHHDDIAVDSSRPQVLISGEIHGDERVGPLSSLLTAKLLTWSAKCVIDHDAHACQSLDRFGGYGNDSNQIPSISHAQRVWLAFLATRRDTYIIPAANCLGYKFHQRNDAGIDPNRDFGYSRRDNNCFLTTTAKVFLAIMEVNLIQLVVTFHGGMVALGYEWGSRNHPRPSDNSPDERANALLGNMMKGFAGSFKNEGAYPVGRINSLIYYVDGGMEDWLYAAGWDRDLVQKNCLGFNRNNKASSRFVGYHLPRKSHRFRPRLLTEVETTNSRRLDEEEAKDTSKEMIKFGGNRALVFLVETSDLKTPQASSLGGSHEILNPKSSENGHVPRNLRLGLMSIDMVQPYVCFQQIEMIASPVVESEDTIDSTQSSSNSGNSHSKSKILEIDVDANNTMNTVTEIVDTVSNHSMTNVSNKTANGSRRLQSDSMNNILSNQKRFGTSNSNKKDNSNSLTYNSGDKKLFSFNPKLSVQWYVGGAHVVDKTFLAWHPSATFNPSNWKAYLETNSFEDHGLDAAIGSQHHHQREKFPLLASSILSGESRWFSNKEMVFETSRFDALPDSSNALFSSTIDFKSLNLTSHLTSGRYWLVAWSVVDQDFAQVNQGFPANSGPQSYYSNIRTKSQFSCESIGEKDCHGKRYWPSDFIEIEIHREASSSDGNKNDYFVKVVDSVKHCAWWEYQSLKNIKGTIPKMNNKDLSATNHEIEIEVEESYFFLSFERGYIILFLSVLFVICMVSMIASYWRRLRVYSTVLNNRYLNLPTGFVRV